MEHFGCVCLCVLFAVFYYLFNRWYRGTFIADFGSKYVFITGTDSGFGHRLAIDLDRAGLNVYAGCYSEMGAKNLKNVTSQRLKTVELDITDQKSVDRAKTFVETDLPEGENLWGLVNNAGVMGNVIFELSEVEEYRQAMEVNFFGHLRVIEAFVPLITKAKGRIVNVTSICGRISVACEPYTCSKFAMEAYSNGLRRSLKALGVKVAIIEPGYFRNTNIMENMTNDIQKKLELFPELKKQQLENVVVKFKRNINFVLTNWPNWNKIDIVTGAMAHALGAQRPRTRYPCGFDARPAIIFGSWAPDWLLDALFTL